MHQTQAGRGILELSYVNGRTAITRAQAASPLKLLCPRRRGPAAWVYTSTFGGGLVAGDQIEMDVRIGPGTTCVISSQSSTKVYKNRARLTSRQLLSANIAADALLVLAPDPVTCFAGATYEQRQRLAVQEGGNLVLIDWLTSGRRARGECWQMSRYYSRLDICWQQDPLLADALLLDGADGPLGTPHRLGRFHCLALAVLLGQRLAPASRRLLDQIGSEPIGPNSQLIAAASPIRHGVLLRVLGATTELVAKYLKERLSFLGKFLGDTPWARKW